MDKTMPCLEIIKEKIFKGAEFRCIEKVDNEILLWLDKFSGIDYIIKRKDNHIFGVAARVQFGKNWQTFTIRFKRKTGAKTEYEKRKEAITKGYFYPTYTLQAYFNNEGTELLGACLVSTIALYDFIEKNPKRITKRESDNIFLIVKWSDLKNTFLF